MVSCGRDEVLYGVGIWLDPNGRRGSGLLDCGVRGTSREGVRGAVRAASRLGDARVARRRLWIRGMISVHFLVRLTRNLHPVRQSRGSHEAREGLCCQGWGLSWDLIQNTDGLRKIGDRCRLEWLLKVLCGWWWHGLRLRRCMHTWIRKRRGLRDRGDRRVPRRVGGTLRCPNRSESVCPGREKVEHLGIRLCLDPDNSGLRSKLSGIRNIGQWL